MRASLVTALFVAASASAVPGLARAQKTRELTTFVYPQTASNTYRLPQYALKGKSASGLSRCGETGADGIRFEPDGQTFHLDPVPKSMRPAFRRSLKVRRGKGSCFRAEIRVVIPLLSEPDPATWVVEWSPLRPDAIDIVVPSTPLANNPDMQALHRLVFPWAPVTVGGAWADCSSGCRWRIPADSSIRRAFLTRAEIPVRVEARPLSGLGPRSGVFIPDNGRLWPRRQLVALSKWKIKPAIRRAVKVTAEQTEVTLDFPGAWALMPTPAGEETALSIRHTPSGPVLRYSDTRGNKAFALTPGGGQLRAYLRFEVEGRSRKFLTYVARFGSTKVRLPPDMRVCLTSPVSTLDIGGVGASRIRDDFISGADKCNKPTGEVRTTLLAPVLRADDVSSAALDWSPKNPNRIDLYVRSRALAADRALREDTELTIGDHAPGTWVGCFAKYCQYRIENLQNAEAIMAPTVSIRSKRLQAETTTFLDATTGRPIDAQQFEVRAWRVPSPTITVGVPFLDGDTEAVGTIGSPVARFFQPGPVSCNASGTCLIDPNEGAMAVRVQGAGAIRISTINVPKVPTTGVSFIHVQGESWEPVKASLRLKMSTCRYSVRQLSRAIAGLNEASVLFQARLRPGSSATCPGDDWSVTLTTGERGHAQLKDGLLEVYLESIPVPGEGGVGDVGLSFEYPSGQKVKIDGGSKMSIEPAPTIGPPRVSVRLPGGDLRPLATTLAVNRPNILYFDSISDPLDWGVELVRARSLYRPCRDADDQAYGDDDKEGPAADFSDDESYGSYCIIPNERTNDSLKLRFVRQGPTRLLLRDGVDPAILGEDEQTRVRRIGWVEVETGRQALRWSIAMDLVPVTELRCGDRVISTTTGVTPRAVDYDDFDSCQVLISLGAPARSGPSDRTPLEDTIAFYGDQNIEVRGRKVDTEDNSGTKVLTTVRLRAETETQDQAVLVIPVSLAEIGAKPPEDYDVVEVEVAHVGNFYSPDEKWSNPNSIARIRIRRGPEYLAWWGNGGRGARLFGAFTATPFSLFRYPHSGKGVTNSSEIDQLETANVALGLAGILELWNFDHNEAIIPVVNPQLQIGALVSSNPTTGDLSLPGISLIAGIGLRTGVGTNPGDTLETALKTVVWYEMLFQRAGRGNTPSHNLLFGFTVDLGSTPN